MARTLTEDVHPLVKLLCEDQRYKLDAYQFVREGLTFAQEKMGAGELKASAAAPSSQVEVRVPRHITGQDLCIALRDFAHERFGYLALPVLKSWGIHTTADFGEIVYNLIKIGEMSKSPSDRREHFEEVYDFQQALAQDYAIVRPS